MHYTLGVGLSDATSTKDSKGDYFTKNAATRALLRMKNTKGAGPNQYLGAGPIKLIQYVLEKVDYCMLLLRRVPRECEEVNEYKELVVIRLAGCNNQVSKATNIYRYIG